MADEEAAAKRRYLEEILAESPSLSERLQQAFLIELHSHGVVSIDQIYAEARSRGSSSPDESGLPGNENVQMARRWDQDEKHRIQEIALDHVAATFSREKIDDLVNLTRKRVEARTLEEIAGLSSVSFGLIAEKVRSFCRLPEGRTTLPVAESMSARVALIRNFISQQLEFQGVAKHFLRIRDFDPILDRIIGAEDGAGLIGGKAAGMLLGASIIDARKASDPEAPTVPIRTPDSYFLRSDALEQFLRHNGLQQLQDHKYRDIEEVRNDYPMLQQLFKNASFPPYIVNRLREMLQHLGNHPLIVRSSSLLEDRFGTTFAGKYRSVFVCNQGTLEQRLAEMLGAIAEVYASSLHPDPISYRRSHDLLDFDENMAVLIQKIVGARAGRYFLPVWAGVALSRNLYRRNPRIRVEDGMARIVFGLGTAAVDRLGRDTPRMVPLGVPTLRPEVTAADICASAQRQVDVIDLAENRFATVAVNDVLAEGANLPGLGLVFSALEHGFLRPLVGDGLYASPQELVVTFDRLTRSSPYPACLRWCLRTLEEAYGSPVDIEFAFDGHELYLLQCRPQPQRPHDSRVSVPKTLEPSKVVFSAQRDISSGSVRQVEFIVLIDPRDYNNLASDSERLAVGRVVRRLNDRLAARRFVLMGPGRWGSRDLRMGIRVGYSDINNTCMLIEVARSQGGITPEVSFGSHFFQDLIESNIHYLALYPDEAETIFNEELLRTTPNALLELVPEEEEMAATVQVVHIPTATGGSYLQVDMDEEEQLAVGYLTD